MGCTTTMDLLRLCTTLTLGWIAFASAQTVAPSNASSDVLPASSSPRFWVNATNVSFLVAPLSFYSQMSHDSFLSIDMEGTLLNVDDSNANSLQGTTFAYISCDPQDYTGVLSASQIVGMVASSQGQQVSIILHSSTANHCSATDLRNRVDGIFTTLDPTVADEVERSIAASSNGIKATILPDPNSYTQYSGQTGGWGSTQSGTSAVAMIVLYTITALITALFLIIIVSGAVRAHRHPERYGPRNIAGRPRQSRAKGVARAMLETLPIVKFGDHQNLPPKPIDADMEMHGTKNTDSSAGSSKEPAVDAAVPASSEAEPSKEVSANATNADGTDEAGQLGCSICTEDFNRGEEVRVLPCNHKFHPECVDPWLLNVSGTCPLCRVDLRPKEEQPGVSAEGTDSQASRRISILDGSFAPPLGPFPVRIERIRSSVRSETMQSLRQTATGTREERIAALRRLRQQRQNRASIVEEEAQGEEDRRGLASRLRERFRIRTRRVGDETGDSAQVESNADGASNQAGRRSTVSPPVPVWTT